MKTLRNTLSIAGKEIQVMVRDRGALAVLLLLPLLLGTLFGGLNVKLNSGEDTAILLEVVVANLDRGIFGQQTAQALETIDELEVTQVTTDEEAEQLVAAGEYKAAIIIPADFSDQINAYTPTTVQVIVDPAEPESASIVTGIMNQVISEVTIWGEVQYGVQSILEDSGALVDAPPEVQQGIAAQTLGAIMAQLNDLRQNPVITVRNEDLSGATVQGGIELFLALLFPCFTVMFAFFVVGTTATSLLGEREAGTLRRLIAAPMSRGAIIAGKLIASMLLVCVQVALLFTVAHLLLGMPLGQSPLALVLVTLALAMVASALGVLVAALAKTAKQADSLSMLLAFVLAAVGGSLPLGPTPLTRTGGFIGVLTKITPHAHAVDAYYSIMAENAGLVQVLPQIGILVAFAVVFFLIAVWRFRFE